LSASDDAQVLVITDVESGNAHISFDGGDTWDNVYTLNYALESSVKITTSAVSSDGTSVAFGFDGQYVQTTTGIDTSGENW